MYVLEIKRRDSRNDNTGSPYKYLFILKKPSVVCRSCRVRRHDCVCTQIRSYLFCHLITIRLYFDVRFFSDRPDCMFCIYVIPLL